MKEGNLSFRVKRVFRAPMVNPITIIVERYSNIGNLKSSNIVKRIDTKVHPDPIGK